MEKENALEHQGMLSQSLMDLEFEYVKDNTYVDTVLDTMVDSFRPMAKEFFQRNFDTDGFSDLAGLCNHVISNFSTFSVVKKLTEMFDLFTAPDWDDEHDEDFKEMNDIQTELSES